MYEDGDDCESYGEDDEEVEYAFLVEEDAFVEDERRAVSLWDAVVVDGAERESVSAFGYVGEVDLTRRVDSAPLIVAVESPLDGVIFGVVVVEGADFEEDAADAGRDVDNAAAVDDLSASHLVIFVADGVGEDVGCQSGGWVVVVGVEVSGRELHEVELAAHEDLAVGTSA